MFRTRNEVSTKVSFTFNENPLKTALFFLEISDIEPPDKTDGSVKRWQTRNNKEQIRLTVRFNLMSESRKQLFMSDSVKFMSTTLWKKNMIRRLFQRFFQCHKNLL